MTSDRFEATFVLRTDPGTAWARLTRHPIDSAEGPEQIWLPGFDSSVTVTESDGATELHATKDDEPCAGTDIIVKLVDHENGTQITVMQSGFGDWMPPLYDVMAVGWRHIVADLTAFLHTGVHARRHLRFWGDLGADATADAGGLRLRNIRPETMASRLSLQDDDLLVTLCDAPVSCQDDLATVLRAVSGHPRELSAEVIRGDALISATTEHRPSGDQ